mmetsp:Transcript_32461/g.68593  ORF Transcript_32461/g.68593 Transcript_32461/m.68593 type:complete len:220 (+) Transcript_32461:2255-2914(+)
MANKASFERTMSTVSGEESRSARDHNMPVAVRELLTSCVDIPKATQQSKMASRASVDFRGESEDVDIGSRKSSRISLRFWNARVLTFDHCFVDRFTGTSSSEDSQPDNTERVLITVIRFSPVRLWPDPSSTTCNALSVALAVSAWVVCCIVSQSIFNSCGSPCDISTSSDSSVTFGALVSSIGTTSNGDSFLSAMLATIIGPFPYLRAIAGLESDSGIK